MSDWTARQSDSQAASHRISKGVKNSQPEKSTATDGKTTNMSDTSETRRKSHKQTQTRNRLDRDTETRRQSGT